MNPARSLHYLHPFLIAVSLPIFLWSNNFSEIALREMLPAIGGLIVFAGFILLVSWIVFRNSRKAAIFASVFLIFILFYEYIFFNSLTSEFMRHRYAFLILFTIIAVIGYLIKKTKGDLAIINQAFVVAAGVFVLVSLLQIGIMFYGDWRRDISIFEQVGTTPTDEPALKRDIYYIILDEYMSPRFLKEALNFDRADDFTDFLEERGFFVAKDSRSNYPLTWLSLPSSLNMQYLNSYLDMEGVKKTQKVVEAVEDHFVKDFLKERDYRYIHFGANEVTIFNRYADENISIYRDYRYLSFLRLFFVGKSTILNAILELKFEDRNVLAEKLGFLDSRFLHWKGIRFQLAELAKVPQRKEPTFTFAHLMIPHAPYVFDKEGNYTGSGAPGTDITQQYLAQVQYISEQMEVLADEILKSSEKEPIIIIQADHGYRFSPEEAKKFSLTPEREADLSARILNSYYFPDGGDKLLYDSITPVNSFRLLLNYYFNQKFELLEDKSYYMSDSGVKGVPPRLIPLPPLLP